jgi:hypothetical protein
MPFLTLYRYREDHISSRISRVGPYLSNALFSVSLRTSGGKLATRILCRPMPAGLVRTVEVSPLLCSYMARPFVLCGKSAAVCAVRNLIYTYRLMLPIWIVLTVSTSRSSLS